MEGVESNESKRSWLVFNKAVSVWYVLVSDVSGYSLRSAAFAFWRHDSGSIRSTHQQARGKAAQRTASLPSPSTALNDNNKKQSNRIPSLFLVPGMSTSFKRVISHEELGSLSKKIMSAEAQEDENKELKKMPAIADTAEAPPLPPAVVIETEENTDETSATLEESAVAAAVSFRGVSTLSEDKSLYETVEESDTLSGISRNELNLARLDSRASDVMARTQRTGSGSSGTFGWFIDVHGGDGGTPKAKDDERKHLIDSKKEEDESEELTQFVDISQQNIESGKLIVVRGSNVVCALFWCKCEGSPPPPPPLFVGCSYTIPYPLSDLQKLPCRRQWQSRLQTTFSNKLFRIKCSGNNMPAIVLLNRKKNVPTLKCCGAKTLLFPMSNTTLISKHSMKVPLMKTIPLVECKIMVVTILPPISWRRTLKWPRPFNDFMEVPWVRL